MRGDDERIDKKLFSAMYRKKVPGFCTQVRIAIEKFGFASIDEVVKVASIRKELKKRMVKVQGAQLFRLTSNWKCILK